MLRRAAIVALVASMIGLSPVRAHALDESYQLPLPLWLYLGGALAAVAASFVVVALADRGGHGVARARALRAMPPRVRSIGSVVLKAVGAVAWFGAMIAGLFGLVHEFLPAIIFWSFFWAGLPIVSALIGNPWPAFSPFRTAYGLATAAARRDLDLGIAYPDRARRWPATAFLFAALMIELTVIGSDLGSAVGALLLGYTLLTLGGMALFGPVAWLRNAEVFEVLLGWFGRLAPLGRVSVSRRLCAACEERCDPDACVDCPECLIVGGREELRVVVRPPLSGMAGVQRAGWSDAAFILLALAGVTFDGLQETRVWVDASRFIESLLVPLFGQQAVFALTGPLGLIGLWLTFLAVFALAAWVSRHLGGIDAPLTGTVGRAAASLLPIAAGYAVAHYGTLLLQGALSLPGMVLDRGAVEAELDWLPAGFVWYLSVAAIVVGHVAAVMLAHREAIRLRPRRVHLAELPLVAIMLAYTVVSLWIIAQPITIDVR